MPIILRATPCIHIVDHQARTALPKYGILLGKRPACNLILSEAFDLKERNGSPDFEFLRKKLELLLKVSGQLSMVGVYSTEAADVPDRSFFEQFSNNGFPIPELFLKASDIENIQCFSVQTGEQLQLLFAPGDAESVAVSTIQNHPNYTQEEQELSQKNEEILALSLAQLQNRVQKILQEGSKGPEHDRVLVHLAQLLTNYKSLTSEDNLQLTTSHLCLLIAQLSAVNFASSQINRRITGLSKSR